MLFGDSSYFVALSDRRDRWHREALRVRKAVAQEFLVSDLVLAETVTIIGDRRGGQAAQAIYEYFTDECEIEFLEVELLRGAMGLHLRYDGSLSVADCVSIALMSQRGIGSIVSFDSDFDRAPSIERIH